MGLSTTTSDETSPSIAIDPLDPHKMVAVWVRNDPTLAPGPTIIVQGAFSFQGGAPGTWKSMSFPVLGNPNTKPTTPFPDATNPSVEFDRNGNFYVLYLNHTADNTAGELALSKFSFAGASPSSVFGPKVVYGWVPGSDQLLSPMLAVDNNVASFTDTFGNGQSATQTDPFSGNVYIAYSTVAVSPATNPTNFNPNTIQLLTSSDGGLNFSGQSTIDGSNLFQSAYFGPQRDGAPQLTISQGRAARPAGANGATDPGQTGLPGGQVSVVWDDYGTGAQPGINPQFDRLLANALSTGVNNGFTGGGGLINDAGPGTPNSPATTSFPISVNLTDPRFTTLSNLTVTVNMVAPTLAELSLELVPPTGSGLSPITLVANQTDASGNNNPFIGISGANLGISTNGSTLGTIFNDNAARDIVDLQSGGSGRGAAAPFIGNFRPEQDGGLAALDGLNAAALNGTWNLVVTDFRNDTTPASLVNWALNFTSGVSRSTLNSVILSQDFVRGATPGANGVPTFPVASAASPTGIGPGVQIASDNTLGAFSPHQGRLYAVFTDRPNPNIVPTPPPDFTFIEMATSDDGGLTWSVSRGPINDDLATQDGFSESDPTFFATPPTGRPHFDPTVTVDNGTGTVVVGWLDARFDAARARVATEVTTSIDGGATFSPDVYANPAQTAKDAITGANDAVGPVPDNQSSGNPNRNTLFGFGSGPSLVAYAGQIHVVWPSSVPGNTGPFFDGGIQGNAKLDVRTATLTTADGPRVVASSMGPVGPTTADNVDPGDPINNNTTADGTPVVQSFHIQFDRPIDPNSFTAADVEVLYRDTTPGNISGGPVPVLKVTPIFATASNPGGTPLSLAPFGATVFRVDFAPRSAAGTYSYVILPKMQDRIRTLTQSIVGGTLTTTTFNAAPSQVNLPIPLDFPNNGDTGNPNSPPTLSHISVNLPANQVINHVSVTLNIEHTFDSDMVITLIAPDGTTVFLSNHLGNEQFVFLGENFTNTTFDDSATTPISAGFGPFNGSFQPDTPLSQLDFHNPTGTWTLSVLDDTPIDVGTLLSWSMTLQTGTLQSGGGSTQTSGNVMDQNADGQPGEPGDFFADPMPTSTANGPFTGPFVQTTLPLIVPGPHVVATHVPGNPTTDDNLVLNQGVSSVDVSFDRLMAMQSFTPADVLRMMGPIGQISGPFTVAAAYNATDVNKPFPQNGQTTVDSILDLSGAANAGFTISHLTVQLNISLAKDSDLTATLIAPDGTRIQLFSRVGGTAGQNFLNTVLDDSAATPIAQGVAPFNATFQPERGPNGLTLSALNGKSLQGVWTLELSDTAGDGIAGVLNSWSIAANSSTPANAQTFRIGFQQQELNGTYVATMSSSIQSKNGDAVDSNLNAGVDLLKGTPSGGIVPVTDNASTVPTSIVAQKTVASTITIPDNFILQGLTLSLSITYPHDPDLTAVLVAPDGTRVQLFSGIGSTGTQANFSNTLFDDFATTPIQNGGPPFFGSFNPQQPLSQLVGKNALGNWTLEVTDSAAVQPAGTAQITSWSLTFKKPVPNTGLGEPVSDQFTAGFRIFTMDPTNSLSNSTWTAVGPAAINSTGSGPESTTGSASGRIGGIAVDPSDPSGNTVYIGGATGGIWKTTDFLTTAPQGPTYVPLTDFGPTFGVNIGSIAIFPKNNDPNQSVIFGATGDGDTFLFGNYNVSNPGVGFLRSMDGGSTWTLLDSTNNNLPFAQRDHLFAKNGGTQSFKIAVDPKPLPNGNIVVYAAFSGVNGGIWRSLDSGQTWQQMLAGQATDLTLDLNSGTGATNGNLQILYAAFAAPAPGAGFEPNQTAGGVYFSPNRGQNWEAMNGGIGDPLIQDAETFPHNPIPVTPPSSTPNAPPNPSNVPIGRIVLAKPALTGNPVQDVQYQGWLYALEVAGPAAPLANHVTGLYLTKDFGQNWTRVRLPNLPPFSATGSSPVVQAVPSNNGSLGDYDVAGGGSFAQGNYDLSIAVDPTNPNIVYLGGTADGQPSGLIRVDVTRMSDPHALVPYNNFANDGGTLTINSNPSAPLALKRNNTPAPTAFYNLIRDPANPFLANATLEEINSARFNNTGLGATWIPFDIDGTDQHRFVTTVDPLTGKSRLIIGDDQGVYTAVDDNGTFLDSAGTAAFATGSRNGNLQITQFYYGAAQPSSVNLQGQIMAALFYGSAQDNGGPGSDPNILNNGNITWSGPGGDATGVATDQTGTGTQYQYFWPCCGGDGTNFFQVSASGIPGDGVGRTFGLLQQSNPGNTPDPQWPFVAGFNFAVNPLNGNQMMISSAAGRIFSTENQGVFWSVIGDPQTLDGSNAQALAYAAPDPNGPGGIGNLDNFLYAGTIGGHIFVTQTGGGANGNQWTNVSAGLDGSAIQAIVPDPTRGFHDAYAVTRQAVYYIGDSTVAGATWQNITGNLFSLQHLIFGDPTMVDTVARYLSSLAVDWRYVIPNSSSNPAGPTTTHPMLYVGGEGGVYRSTDDGTSWDYFPNDTTLGTLPATPGEVGGPPPVPAGQVNNLPIVHVSDMDLSLGDINPTNGRPIVTQNSPNILLATTFGQGQFAIRLAPVVFGNTIQLDPVSDSSHGSNVTNVTAPLVDGLSEQTAFGNVVTIDLIDETNPNNPVIIGTGTTDSTGRFQVQVTPGYFKSDGSSDGVKTIGVQGVDQAGTKGNIASFQFTLETKPPSAPGAPVLEANSDSGLSSSDGITNVTNPVFDVSTEEPPSTTVILLRDGTVVNQVNGPVPLSFNSTNVPLTFGQAGSTTIDSKITVPNSAALLAHLTVSMNITLAQDSDLTATLIAPDGTRVTLFSGVGGAGQNFSTITLDDIADTPVAQGIAPFNGSYLPAQGIDAAVAGKPVSGTWTLELTDVANDGKVGTLNSWSLAQTSPVAIQDPGTVPDGIHVYTAKQIDLAGNISPLSGTTSITVDTTPPVQPPAPVLLPADDSGVKGDNITSVTRPHLTGTGEPGGIIQLIDVAGNIVGQAAIGASGSYTVQPTNALADGVYTLRVQDEDVAGNISAPSAPLTLTILTKTPGAPTIALDPADDSGQLGDNITNVTSPRFIGLATAGISVDLLNVTDSNNIIVVATTIAAPNGTYLVQYTPPLTDGIYKLEARARDVAGNFNLSAPLTVQILTKTTGGAPTLTLVAADDTGTKGDNVTSVRRPHFTGRATPGVFVDLAMITRDANGNVVRSTVVATTTAGSTGSYTLQLPADLTNGQIDLQAVVRDIAGNQGTPSADLKVTIVTTGDDYNTDGKGDLALFQANTALWTIAQSNGANVGVQFGAPGDIPIQGDFDGDGKIDVGVFRPSTATWYILRSTAGPEAIQFGAPNLDIPVPADFDGDGRADLAVYRPTTGQWFVLESTGGGKIFQFGGAPGDIPVPATYEGGTAVDLAVFRPSNGTWYIDRVKAAPEAIQFGAPNLDVPVPGDYDGDGVADVAVFRPTTAEWFILQSTAGPRYAQFGAPGDVPVPSDYDGDGKFDLAVFHSSTAVWSIANSSGGTTTRQFGAPGSLAAAAPYSYRAPHVNLTSVMGSGGSGGGGLVRSLNFGQQAASLTSSTSSSSSSSVSRSLQGTPTQPPAQDVPPTSGTLGTGLSPIVPRTKRFARVPKIHHTVTHSRINDIALEHVLNGIGRPGSRRHS
jgi:subtilisin-like proprotein convertase family protein